MSGEHPKPDVIKKSITNPETGGTLTLIHKRDAVADTIGHVLALPQTLMLGTGVKIDTNPTPEFIDQILDTYKNVTWKGEVVVRLGHTDVKEDWERAKHMITDDGAKKEALKRIGKPFMEFSALRARLFRASSYNPFSKTVHLFHDNMGILAHELGHHEDIELHGTRVRGLFTKLKREYQASNIAMARLPDDQARKEAMKTLEPAFGTYLGNLLGKWYLTGKFLYLFAQGTKSPMQTDKVPLNQVAVKLLKEMVIYNSVKMAPVIAGHVYARLPWRKSSFGYVFEGKQPEQTLKSHQVLVATANATG